MKRHGGAFPDEVVVSRDRLEMTLRWTDGSFSAFSARALRSACRCAWCTHDRLLDRFEVAGDEIALARVEAIGSHGLHIKFTDGHERGIYPWPYLDELASAGPIAARHGECAVN